MERIHWELFSQWCHMPFTKRLVYGGCLRPWLMARPVLRTPALLYTVYSPCVCTPMYTIINQCCPNRSCYLPVHSGDLDSSCTYLLYCSLYSFSFTRWATHSASRLLSLSPMCVFIANLQCTFQVLQHFLFVSKLFHICFTSKPAAKN